MAAIGRGRRSGRVVSNKMDKTIVVEVELFRRHRIYRKPVRVRRRLVAHDVDNTCEIGDLVEIEESRPLSRRKRWRLVTVAQRAALTVEEEAAVATAAQEGMELDSEADETPGSGQ